MRDLTIEVTAAKNSPRFSYYDCAEIHLPFGPGDVFPRVLYVSSAEVEVEATFDYAGFVYTSFAGALNRPPTSTERADWITDLEAAFAVDEATLRTVAQGLIDDLFESSEYSDRMRNDEQFVGDLYLAFFGRVPDPGGKAFWLGQILATDRDAVRDQFGNADEFFARLSKLTETTDNVSDARDMGDLSFADGAALDGVDFALTNLDNSYSDLIGQLGRRLYPAPAVVSRAIRIADGSFVPTEMLAGFAKFTVADGENARVSVVSDISRRGIDVVEIDSQRCRNIYKGDGCDSPDSSPTCSKLFFDTVNGCPSKAAAPQILDTAPPDNRPSFKGTPQLSPGSTPGAGIQPGTEGPGGWPEGEYDPWDPRKNKSQNNYGDGGFFLP